ncbi:MAG: (Fe-S)-binding protein [Eggerthellaceae bacterium]|nr:(Fe-S)-binding protein [Eggerthellaceae bacterium]
MEEYLFEDALTGSTVAFDRGTGDARIEVFGDGAPRECPSLFFPGCSLINYAMPLVSAVHDTLLDAGSVDGISLLCCGRILSFEEGGDVLRASFDERMRLALRAAGVRRIVAACPNCAEALRGLLDEKGLGDEVEVVALPAELARLGYRVDRDTAALLVKGDAEAPLVLAAHDSCPDRARGEFADGMRALLPEGLCVEPAHSRARSLCCGSLLRAAGKFDAADKLARRNGEEAGEAGADALVTACLSCAFQLNAAQDVPAVHFLELLYAWRVNWGAAAQWMKIRFLFEETLGVAGPGEGRAFVALTPEDAEGAEGVEGPTRAERALVEAADEDALTPEEAGAASAVSLTNEDVEVLGE